MSKRTFGILLLVAVAALIIVYAFTAQNPSFNTGPQAAAAAATPPTLVLTSSASVVQSGGMHKLYWEATNATSCSASGAWTAGSIGTKAQETFWNVTSTRTYTVTCTGLGGSATKSVTVAVAGAGTVTPAPTLTLTSSASSVAYGGEHKLYWRSTDATSCTASGAWSGSSWATNAQETFRSLTSTRTYTLTCTGAGGSVSKSVTVTVGNTTTPAPTPTPDPIVPTPTPTPTPTPSAAPTLSFTLSASSIAYGGTHLLYWQATNATSCAASGAWSGTNWGMSGQETFKSLTSSRTYIYTCTGAGGTVSKSVTVTVGAAPTVPSTTPTPAPTPTPTPAAAPTLTLTLDKTSVANGGSVKLTWASANATSCTAFGGWTGARIVSGTATMSNLTSNTTYMLTCTGAGGTVSKSVTTTITAVTPTPTPTPVPAGGYTVAQASYLDGTNFDEGRDVDFDSKGNLYVTGGASVGYPTTAGAHDTTFGTGGSSMGSLGPMDVFLTKIAPDGSVIWSTYFGGPNYDRAYAVEVGPDDSVYIAGRAGDQLPTTSGVVQRTFAGASATSPYGKQDGFVARFTSDGQLIWSTYVGDTAGGIVRDIDIDSKGNIHAAVPGAITTFTPFITANALQKTNAGFEDAAYVVLSPDASKVLYGTYFGGSTKDGITPSVRVAASGDVYFYTISNADNIPITAGSYQTTRKGLNDGVLAKFRSDYSLAWSTYIGGTNEEGVETHQLAVDPSGNAYITGNVNSPDFPTTAGAYDTSFNGGCCDAFIAKISADGKQLLASTFIGGSGRDEGEGIAYSPSDNTIVLTGNVRSTNFPTTANAADKTLGGTSDFFIVKMSLDLKTLIYSTYYGGSGFDGGRSLVVSNSGRIVSGGEAESADFAKVNSISPSLRGQAAAAFVTIIP